MCVKATEGNVVLGYESRNFVLLDCDLRPQEEVIEFAREYAKSQRLGSALVLETSWNGQVDLSGKPVGKKHAIIFGKKVTWKENCFHLNQALEIGIIEEDFADLRKYGSTTIRVNAKNSRTPHPKVVHYYRNGDDTGVKSFLRYWEDCKSLGFGERGDEDDKGKRPDAEERPWRMGDKNLC